MKIDLIFGIVCNGNSGFELKCLPALLLKRPNNISFCIKLLYFDKVLYQFITDNERCKSIISANAFDKIEPNVYASLLLFKFIVSPWSGLVLPIQPTLLNPLEGGYILVLYLELTDIPSISALNALCSGSCWISSSLPQINRCAEIWLCIVLLTKTG